MTSRWWNIQTWLPNVNITSGYTYTASFTLVSSAPKYFTVDNQNGDAQYFAQPEMSNWVDNGDGTYTYNYTIDENYLIYENGKNLPKQKYVLTDEEKLRRYEEHQEWGREHCRKLNNSMYRASKEWYK